jgi:hypothetical protein
MNNRFKGNTTGFHFDFMNKQRSSSNDYGEYSLQAVSSNCHSQFFDTNGANFEHQDMNNWEMEEDFVANGTNVEQQDMNNWGIDEEDASYVDTGGYSLQTETDAISCPITNNQDAFNDREANTMAAAEDMGDVDIQEYIFSPFGTLFDFMNDQEFQEDTCEDYFLDDAY